jgi:hypothetical protein
MKKLNRRVIRTVGKRAYERKRVKPFYLVDGRKSGIAPPTIMVSSRPLPAAVIRARRRADWSVSSTDCTDDVPVLPALLPRGV